MLKESQDENKVSASGSQNSSGNKSIRMGAFIVHKLSTNRCEYVDNNLWICGYVILQIDE